MRGWLWDLHPSMLGHFDGQTRAEPCAHQMRGSPINYRWGDHITPDGPAESQHEGRKITAVHAKVLLILPKTSLFLFVNLQDSMEVNSQPQLAAAVAYCAVFFRGPVRMKWANGCLLLVRLQHLKSPSASPFRHLHEHAAFTPVIMVMTRIELLMWPPVLLW